MPTRDGTGPMGQGSQTGRGMGNCETTGDNTEKTSNPNPTPGGAFRRGEKTGDSTIGRLFRRRRGSRKNRQ